MKLKQIRKALVAVAGLVAQIVAAGTLPASYQNWAVAILALFTALGVYAVPNASPYVPKHVATEEN